ncbi:MAG: hypothetical protein GXO26_05870 [Crenarchaeota archaeon]|nr:hypothetical protein [Thermoproteota archaeon]
MGSFLKTIESYLIHGVTRAYIVRWFVISAVMGVIIGSLVWILGKASNIILRSLVLPILGYSPSKPPPLIFAFSFNIFMKILPLLIIGHILSYIIVTKICEEARGSGCDIAFYNYANRRYLFRLRVPFMKVLATLPTLSLGASVGKEGPAVLIGASSSSVVEKIFRMDLRDLKVAYVAGVASGISAALSSPLGGTVFGIEFLRVYEIEFEILEVLYPSLVASIVSYLTTVLLSGGVISPVISLAGITLHLSIANPWVICSFIFLGVIVGGLTRVYAEVYHLFKATFFKLKYSPVLPPLIAAIAVAFIGATTPLSITTGYDWLNNLIHYFATSLRNFNPTTYAIMVLFLVVVFKIIATSITIASGASGGMVAPTLVTGGYIGLLTFLLFKLLAPAVATSSLLSVLTIAGAATLLGCVYRIPVASILIVSGMTETWPYTPLIALSMAIAYIVTGHWTIHPKFKH